MINIQIDPNDPTKVLVAVAVDEHGLPEQNAVLMNVHLPDQCSGETCVIHNPSDHPMKDWTLIWRDDRYMFERLCPEHGIGHPDPDSLAHLKRVMKEEGDWASVHGCCGCCRTEVDSAGSSGDGGPFSIE